MVRPFHRFLIAVGIAALCAAVLPFLAPPEPTWASAFTGFAVLAANAAHVTYQWFGRL